MNKIIAFVNITRPINLLITFVVVIISAIICSDYFNLTTNIILAGLSAGLVAASGNIINDYFDYNIDKINRPERPIPSGIISRKEALSFYLLLSLLAYFISSLISIEAFLIVIVTASLLFLYSYLFKSIPLLGNLVVALCTALAFFYGGIIVGNANVAVVPAIFAFLINLIREILKDIEDLEGDAKNKISTFPTEYGEQKSIYILIGVSILLIASTFYPFISKTYNIEYFLIVLFFVNIPMVFFIKKMLSDDFFKWISKMSLLLKIVMIFGLVAIYVGLI